jgi:hypothetical protein
MEIDLSVRGEARISMKGYIEKVLDEFGHVKKFTSPARSDILDSEEKLLDEAEATMFHSFIAMVLYIAKRIRPDLLFAVSILCGRVKAPSILDKKSLDRCLGYLSSTQDEILILRAVPIVIMGVIWFRVWQMVDASHAVHTDMRGHDGMTTSLGCGTLQAKSSKQDLNTKSSSESEKVAVGEHIGCVYGTHQFLIDAGYNMLPPMIFEDNMSTIDLIRNGRSKTDRTRHIAIRRFVAVDKVTKGEILIEHCPTAEMIADILTKPMSGSPFKYLRDMMLGKSVSPIILKGCAGKQTVIQRTDVTVGDQIRNFVEQD